MKIGIFISPAHCVPPDEKNILAPWVLVQELADGLSVNNHHVHLFASSGSITQGELHDFGIKPTYTQEPILSDIDYHRLVVEKENLLFAGMIEVFLKEKLDLLHIHQPIAGFYEAIRVLPKHIPFIFTLHDPITPARMQIFTKMQQLGNCHFVSISLSQQHNTNLKFVGNIYNGVSLDVYKYNFELLEYAPCLVVGRIVVQKGFDDAIKAVKQAGEKLILAGQVYQEQPEAYRYYQEKIAPNIDGNTVIMEPLLRRDHLVGHYQMAKALLFPIKWEEPFGLVMVEAMACGTPVIAYNRGSVSEIVRDGVTGFIVEPEDAESVQPSGGYNAGRWIIKKRGVAGLVEAVQRIGEIDRAACRKHIEENFSVEKMVEGYERVYEKVISDKKQETSDK